MLVQTGNIQAWSFEVPCNFTVSGRKLEKGWNDHVHDKKNFEFLLL